MNNIKFIFDKVVYKVYESFDLHGNDGIISKTTK